MIHVLLDGSSLDGSFLSGLLIPLTDSGRGKVHYGLLANRCRRDNLRLCRQLLGSVAQSDADTEPANSTDAVSIEWLCPLCQKGSMRIVAKLPGSGAGPEPRMNSPTAA